jgi:cyclopropane-fatty-acyl-phospholipid synthase
LAALAQVRQGSLEIEERGQRQRCGRPDTAPALDAELQVHDGLFWSAVAWRGCTGAAESFVRGEWTTSDLTRLMRFLLVNQEAMSAIDSWALRLAEPLRRLVHWQRRNTRRGSRRNIAGHYDLGNDFFARFLDETWTYSCAVFEHPQQSLAEAQAAKYDRICRLLRLAPADEVLEIGGGWGGFALHAAARYGCRVTTTTISREQYRLARERVDQAGLADRVTVLAEDYRDVRGQYDKLASIEMIEAVGHRFLGTYFAQCARLLRPQGLMALQAITIPDRQYDAYRRSVDFIQQYIFPGGLLPSLGALLAAAARRSDLQLVSLADLTADYARTLRHWRERFRSQRAALLAAGRSPELLRLWEFYFSYCEAGFSERFCGAGQMLLARPGWRPPT